MVKLASARESRMYGPLHTRNRSEYMNAGLYVFATVMLVGGFVAQFSMEPKSGLVVILIGLGLVILVNVHDLVAHLAGIDYRLFALMEHDLQLGLVEFAVPLVQSIGTLLSFLAILFIFIQEEMGYGYYKLEKHAVNMLIAGAALWLIGSIHNSCQVYERADAHVQVLQESVHIPFLLGSLLFLVGSILNCQEQVGMFHHGLDLLSGTLIWLAIFGSFLFFVGGLANVIKVFKMQQVVDGLRLEKLRRGAQERLADEREARVPLILEEQGRRKRNNVEVQHTTTPNPTPYRDVLVG
ncbi:uncharacterized protein LOC141689401 [Apium graveolens]|uniref:uncharacterized protein LOC141689401 n=1 Tax=Apium graveolens TaxID=4045 RepID=UPI003D7A4FDF